MSAPGSPSSFESAPSASAWAIEHADEIGFFATPPPKDRVEVVLLTDPWSVWCWGFEPVRRAIEHRYPSIHFRHLVGGMFPRMPNPEEVGFNVERFFATVQRTTGMPLRLDASRNDRPTSTYPACIHWHAVRLLRPDLEGAYLRALREAVYLDACNVSRPAVAADVSQRVGVPRDEFEEALASGEPEREFRESLARLHTNALHAYPTYIVRSGERLVRVEGFQTLPGILNLAEAVSGRMHVALPAPPAEAIIAPGERVATREIAEALDVGLEEAYDLLRELEDAGVLARERLPNGDAWSRL